jgi:hypothetical protein
MAAHPIVHIELAANNPEEAAKFYNNLFDWKIDVDHNHSYWMFTSEEGRGGGFNPVGTEGMFPVKPGDVLIYVDTDDIERDLARAESLGGKIIAPKTDIPGVGWFGVFQDPTGNNVGLYTNLPRQES